MKTLRSPVVLALVVVLSACGIGPPSATTPWCDNEDVLMLEAQSVPTAQFVPCILVLPLSWEASGSDIGDGHSIFALDSDIGGNDAVLVELRERCAVEDYVRVPTDQPGTQRYERVERLLEGFRGERLYVFDGGCVRIDIALEAGSTAALVNEASLAIGLVSRSALQEGIRQVTEGRVELDPPADR